MRNGLLAMGLCLAWIGCGPGAPDASRETTESFCERDDHCEEGLVCQEGACRPEIRARFCNCALRERLRADFGNVELVAPFGQCSPCARVPWDERVPLRIRDAMDRELEAWEVDTRRDEPTDLLLEPELGRPIPDLVPYWPVGCEDTRWECTAAGE